MGIRAWFGRNRAIGWLLVIALVLFVACLVRSLCLDSSAQNFTSDTCRSQLLAESSYKQADGKTNDKEAYDRMKVALDPANYVTAMAKTVPAPDKLTWAQGLQASDAAGTLRVIALLPETTTLNRRVCVAVAGVVSATVQQKERDKASSEGKDLVGRPLYVFLNGKRAKHLSAKALPVTGTQYLTFPLAAPADAKADGAGFLRELLSGGATFEGESSDFGNLYLSVGLSRFDSDVPESTAEKPVTVAIIDMIAILAGSLSLVLLLVAFILFARQSTLLRDHSELGLSDDTATARNSKVQAEADAGATKANAEAAAERAKGQAKTGAEAADAAQKELDLAEQALKANPADNNLVAARDGKEAALKAALAGKASNDAAVTMADAETRTAEQQLADASEQLKIFDRDNPKAPLGPYSLARSQMAFWLFVTVAGFVYVWLAIGQYANLMTVEILALLGISGATGLAAAALTEPDLSTRSTNFLQDILSDKGGPQLFRIQAVVWTLLLGVIFVYNVVWNFVFVEFDPILLALIGFSSSAYIGFKLVK